MEKLSAQLVLLAEHKDAYVCVCVCVFIVNHTGCHGDRNSFDQAGFQTAIQRFFSTHQTREREREWTTAQLLIMICTIVIVMIIMSEWHAKWNLHCFFFFYIFYIFKYTNCIYKVVLETGGC